MARTTSQKQIGVLLGQNIQRLRKERGLLQQELAERVGIEPVSVSRLETGASLPSVVRLAEIAEALDVSLAELVGGASPSPSDQAKEITECLARVSEKDRYLLVEIVRKLAGRLAA